MQQALVRLVMMEMAGADKAEVILFPLQEKGDCKLHKTGWHLNFTCGICMDQGSLL